MQAIWCNQARLSSSAKCYPWHVVPKALDLGHSTICLQLLPRGGSCPMQQCWLQQAKLWRLLHIAACRTLGINIRVRMQANSLVQCFREANSRVQQDTAELVAIGGSGDDARLQDIALAWHSLSAPL